MAVCLKGKKILVLGASGFVGFSLALELAKTNEVHGMARFRDASVRRRLEDAGLTIIVKDVTKNRLDDVPTDGNGLKIKLSLLGCFARLNSLALSHFPFFSLRTCPEQGERGQDHP